jgi:hypothetical protein
MNGREEWAAFAAKNGIEWVEGPPKRCDQHGEEYDTYIWDGTEERLLKYLGADKYVTVRMFPHRVSPLGSFVRMRFCSYSEKPA